MTTGLVANGFADVDQPSAPGSGWSLSVVNALLLYNQLLTAEAQAAMHEVQRSRANIAATAERERKRIERDLHDGAQQRLVALRIELELAEEVIRDDPAAGVTRIHELGFMVDEALDELRSLAHGVYPTLLAQRGIADAVRAAAAQSAIPVTIDVRDLARYAPEVESTVYFCICEALQNANKHARGAHRIVVRLDGHDSARLRFSIHDDGPGLEAAQHGAGLTNMHDRQAAVGGQLDVTSSRRGTTVRGDVPTDR
jgi:signal transduction histidine kinase